MKNRVIDIRDKRLPKGRLTISSRTSDPLEYELRKRTINDLLEQGSDGLAVITALRERKLRIEDVVEKARKHRIADLLEEAESGPAPGEPAPIMLGATVDRFLMRAKAKLAEGTFVQYAGFCAGMEEAFGVRRSVRGDVVEDVPVISIDMEAAESWLHSPKDRRGAAPKPWSARRQTVAHAVASQIWSLAIEIDEERSERSGVPRTIRRNIWAKGRARVQPPKIRMTRVVFLTRQQAGRLLWVTRGRPEAVVMALGIYAGLRAGEITHLRMGVDVKLDTGEIHIQARKGEHPWRPKTNNSTREVPMSRELARWIRAHIRSGYSGTHYLIHPAGHDRPLSPKTRERWAVAAYRRAGIRYGRDHGEGATLHTLRHTFASWLAQKDFQLLKIAQLMGDRVQEVERTYAHLLPRDLRAAVNQLRRK